MARKTLSDFNNDYQAYADYLESAQCLQDDGIDVYGQGRNVYTPTDGDWTKGHGHYVDNSGLGKKDWERKSDDKDSQNRPWHNKWLKYADKLNLTQEEIQFLSLMYNSKHPAQVNEFEEENLLSKRK